MLWGLQFSVIIHQGLRPTLSKLEKVSPLSSEDIGLCLFYFPEVFGKSFSDTAFLCSEVILLIRPTAHKWKRKGNSLEVSFPLGWGFNDSTLHKVFYSQL